MEVCKRKWHLPGKLWIVHVSLENLDTPATCPVTISKLLINPSPQKNEREQYSFWEIQNRFFQPLFLEVGTKTGTFLKHGIQETVGIVMVKNTKSGPAKGGGFSKRRGEINFFCSWVS